VAVAAIGVAFGKRLAASAAKANQRFKPKSDDTVNRANESAQIAGHSKRQREAAQSND
jgi:hypothetical protein